jgi:ElaB/YqjD/DUF883 family membrane-anchored ribosome-binding protein
MSPNSPSALTHDSTDAGARLAEDTLRSVQRSADQTLGKLSSAAQDLHQQVSPLIDRVSGQASALAQRSAEAMRERSLQLRDQALRASDHTLNYIRDEPVKSMLIAAATGAAVMALFSLLRKS